jgi:release factor glutamine methyltransferase
MTTIKDIFAEYHKKIDFLDLELLIAHELKKPREFVLAHPEYKLPKFIIYNLKFKISRRMRGEPLAYILGRKGFFGLDFKVNRHTLIPRPETELLVELATQEARIKKQEINIIDLGTGSGNIIISLAYNINCEVYNNAEFFAVDISSEALEVAKQNAKLHKVDKKIKFLKGDLLEPIIKIRNCLSQAGKPKTKSLIILANLPYLSEKIYVSAMKDVKKYEPKSALYSPSEGLAHYEKLLQQIKKHCSGSQVLCFMEISPEQKTRLKKIIKLYFLGAEVDFFRDLAGKWRVCKIEL